MTAVTFKRGNAKLAKYIAVFDLPAGHTCPFAKDCLAKADRDSGKITDGAQALVRCYAASLEGAFKNVRDFRWRNFEALKGKSFDEMVEILDQGLRAVKGAAFCRIHTSGDFFSQQYFDAWLAVVKRHPEIIFYCYTKALPFWMKRKDDIPGNFRLTASRGGKRDDLIDPNGLRSAVIVKSRRVARENGLQIDHDDRHAFSRGGDFALLIHGTQKPGEMGDAWAKVKATEGGYGKRKRRQLSLRRALEIAQG